MTIYFRLKKHEGYYPEGFIYHTFDASEMHATRVADSSVLQIDGFADFSTVSASLTLAQIREAIKKGKENIEIAVYSVI
jgi:hypothetical protein